MTNKRSWLFVFSMLFLACGSDSSSGNSETATVAESQFAEEYAKAICAQKAPCCEAEGMQPDSNCESSVIATLQSLTTPEGTEKNYTYDASAAAVCISAAKKQPTRCLSSESSTELRQACGPSLKKVYIGTLAPGKVCTSSRECAPPEQDGWGACDVGSSQGGICIFQLEVADGAACDDTPNYASSTPTQRICSEGSKCGLVSKVCERYPGEGESCETTMLCAGSLGCLGSPPVCTVYATEGQPCGAGCAPELLCGASGTCVPRQKIGEACDGSSESSNCLSYSCVDNVCAFNPWASVNFDGPFCAVP